MADLPGTTPPRRTLGGARRPKSLNPDEGAGGVVREGADARAAIAEASSRTTSRRELQTQPGFDEVSPEVGVLDPDAFDRLLGEDTDQALTLLAAMTGATDASLREIARRLAGRVVVDLARTGPTARRGTGRLARTRDPGAEGDVDLEASLDVVVAARAARRPPHGEELTRAAWRRPDTAVCLVIDRSGSMSGERLMSACVAAAAVVHRAGQDCSIVAFSDEAIVLKSQGEPRAPEDVVGDLLSLRGHGPTDLSLGMRVASDQLVRSRAPRRLALLFSDGRATAGSTSIRWSTEVGSLAVIAPEGDTADATALAAHLGGRCVAMGSLTRLPEVLATALAP